jgi:hypothetical protein
MVTESERTVFDRPTRIDPRLMGQPLAAPWRRLSALIVDITIVLIPSVVVAVAAAVVSLRLTDPDALRAIRAEMQRSAEGDPAPRIDRSSWETRPRFGCREG